MAETIGFPTACISNPYEAGMVIDCTNPPTTTDLDKPRKQLIERMAAPNTDVRLLLNEANDYMIAKGMSSTRDDIRHSLERFTSENDVTAALEKAHALIGRKAEGHPQQQLLNLLQAAGILEEPQHFPTMVQSHMPQGITELSDDGTHFGYVFDGENSVVLSNGREFHLYPNTYFSIPESAEISGTGRIQIITRLGVKGLMQIGGEVEDWGRLRYIDGCSDTLLVPPVKRGDPCLNALFIPPNVNQTQHTHPSLRTGVVVEGEGMCKTPSGELELKAGNFIFLPPEACHSFHTVDKLIKGQRSALKVVVYHPDSDMGSTDEEHVMRNRTQYEFLHRLASLRRSTDAV